METLGIEFKDGVRMDLGISTMDWVGMGVVAQECLYRLHKELDKEDAPPNKDILITVFLVRRLVDGVVRYDKKIDQLIAENSDVQNELASLKADLKDIVDSLIDKEIMGFEKDESSDHRPIEKVTDQ